MFDLCSAVFSMTSEELRHAYASLTETRLWSALCGTVSDSAAKVRTGQSQQGKAFQQRLSDAIRRDSTLSDEDICYGFLFELCSSLGVSPSNLVARQDCLDLCDRIVREAVSLYARQHPNIQVSTGKDLVDSVMSDLVRGLSRFAPASEVEVEQQTTALEAYLSSLPEHQQEEIRMRLGVEELSKSMLTKLIAQGSLGSVFAVVIEVAGFAAYKGVVVALSSIAGLVGVTLPFIVYTTLTSLIAVISNPVFLAAFIGGGGVVQYSKKERSLREQFIPVMVAVTMASNDPTRDRRTTETRMDAVVSFWQRTLGRYLESLQHLDTLRSCLELERGSLAESKATRRRAMNDLQACRTKYASMVASIAGELAANDRLVMELYASGPGSNSAATYFSLKYELGQVSKQTPESGLRGIWGGLRRGITQGRLELLMEKELKNAAEMVADFFPRPVLGSLNRYADEAASIKAESIEAEARKTRVDQDIGKLERTWAALREEIREMESSIAKLRRKFPALEQIDSKL